MKKINLLSLSAFLLLSTSQITLIANEVKEVKPMSPENKIVFPKVNTKKNSKPTLFKPTKEQVAASKPPVFSKKQQPLANFINRAVLGKKTRTLTLQELDIIEKDINLGDGADGWKAVVVKLGVKNSFKLPPELAAKLGKGSLGKVRNTTDIFFEKNGLFALTLYNDKLKKNYKDLVRPTVPNALYDKEHLVYGNENAKNKILVFSDPLCPFCKETLPDIFKYAKANPSELAIYYYHKPLMHLHKLSGFISRVLIQAKRDGRPDLIAGVYSLTDKEINPTKTTEKEFVELCKKKFKYAFSVELINENKKLDEQIKRDGEVSSDMMVDHTPFIFLNGKWDRLRKEYLKVITNDKNKK